jgi:WD40 repeat protein
MWNISKSFAESDYPDHTPAPVNSIAFSSDDRRFASGGYDGLIKVSTLAEHSLRTLHPGGPAMSVAFGREERDLFAAVLRNGSPGLRLIEMDDKTDADVRHADVPLTIPVQMFEMSGSWPVRFSEDATKIAYASDFRTIQLVSTADFSPLKPLSGVTAGVYGLASSPNGRWLVIGTGDKGLRVWDAITAQERQIETTAQQTISSIDFSDDSQRFTSVSDDHHVDVWDAKTGKRLYWVDGKGHAVYGDGRWVAWETNNNITIRSAQTREILSTVAVKPRFEVSELVP